MATNFDKARVDDELDALDGDTGLQEKICIRETLCIGCITYFSDVSRDDDFACASFWCFKNSKLFIS